MRPTASGSLLLVDDDALAARGLARELSQCGWSVRLASNGAEALDLTKEELNTAIVVDLEMPGMDGVRLIEQLRQCGVSSRIYLLTAHANVESTVRAVRAGALDVFEKPLSGKALDARLRALNSDADVLASQAALRPAAGAGTSASQAARPTAASAGERDVGSILGDAAAIRAVREQIRTVARFRDLPVLIVGETGTGKELVAQAVHSVSEAEGPFVPVNCAAIPETLFESELFGHEAGSFTGARGAHAGLFEVAARGTLFLDEIGELPAALQPKLLRALETRSFRRVGGTRDIPFRARVISATHRRLTGADSSMREDLYYRLAGFTIGVPALRDRASDIDMLARHFLQEFATRYGVQVTFSPRALDALHAHHWPGNVRELRAIVQQAAVLSEGARVSVSDLTAVLRGRREEHTEDAAPISEQSQSLSREIRIAPRESLRALERRTILETWESSGKNLSAAARTLGLPRTTLRDRLRKYGLR